MPAKARATRVRGDEFRKEFLTKIFSYRNLRDYTDLLVFARRFQKEI